MQDAMSGMRDKLREDEQALYEARVAVLKSRYEEDLAFAEHLLAEKLAGIDAALGFEVTRGDTDNTDEGGGDGVQAG